MALSASPYGKGPVKTIDEVLDRQHEIEDFIKNQNKPDGIGTFNSLYITITEQVRDGCEASTYKDNDFMRALDVAFANRYFAALRRNEHDPGSAPAPWKVFLEHRATEGIQALQFAAAGVNAHINFDLAPAVFATWREVGPGTGPEEHLTYQAIDAVFAAEMESLRQKFEEKWEREVDGGPIAKFLDLLGDVMVDGARDLAWHHAMTLWKWRRVPLHYHLTMDWLSVTAFAAGELLLLPLPSLPN
ncbi:MAG TPA: DUF5995 family protein [Actinomycetota bacterium]|nr:DUF5995 family protein [Actinomycetota bacterium]